MHDDLRTDYDYRCMSCDEVFVVHNRPIGYLGEEKCPACGEPARRIFRVYDEPPGGKCGAGKK